MRDQARLSLQSATLKPGTAVFLKLLVLVLAAGVLHFGLSSERTPRRAGRLLVLWVLVGYCGLPMAWVAKRLLLDPAATLADFGFDYSRELALFFGWAYLGMALLAILSGLYRGRFAAAAALLWAVYFGGATLVHLGDLHRGSPPSHASIFAIFVAHGLIAVLLLSGLAVSGWWKPEKK